MSELDLTEEDVREAPRGDDQPAPRLCLLGVTGLA
jgi:hypothetical protein